MRLDSLEYLYEGQICDLYSAEKQIYGALPNLIEAANRQDLKAAFSTRMDALADQMRRLDWIMGAHKRRPNGHVCRGMHGVLAEGTAILRLDASQNVLDVGIASAVRRIDYYMMAGYLSALGIATSLGLHVEAEILQDSLFTEESIDDVLKDFPPNGGDDEP